MSRPYAVFMLLKATPAWRELAHEDRQAVRDRLLMRVFERFPEVILTSYDAEPFNPRYTEIAVWQTPDLAQYHGLATELRDTEFFGHCSEVLEVITGVQDEPAEEPALRYAGAGM